VAAPCPPKAETSRTIAQLAGPAIAGCVVRLITAPLAIAFDAASFLVGALTAASIPTHEEAPAPAEARRHILSEARQGLSFQALHWCGYALPAVSSPLRKLPEVTGSPQAVPA